MCGFVGVVNFSENLNNEIKIQSANDLMIKRGPDSEGYFSNNFSHFGFRRLSILDLTEAGNQPMISDNRRYVCVFNGEIYNYKKIFEKLKDKFKWKSKSDTEVLLNSYIYWGDDFVNKLDGMFAFAILDINKKTLFCARDRYGEKPFFYFKKNNYLYFASSLSSLETISNEFFNYDNSSISDFVNFGHTSNSKTIFDKVFKLPPGSYFNYSRDQFTFYKYNDLKENTLKTLDKNYFDSIIKESVRDKLNSDRPVGVFLSSGIDSSLIAHLSKKENSYLKTFSIGFKNKIYDESSLSKKFANLIQSKHHEKIISEQDLLSELMKIKGMFDEPITDPSLIPTLIMARFAKSNGVDVCLSGDGGDELFGGYNYYTLMRYKLTYLKIPYLIRLGIEKLISKNRNHKYLLLKNFLSKKDVESSFTFLKSLKKDFFNVVNFDEKDLELKNFDNYLSFDTLNSILNYDINNNLIDNYLVKLDRASMNNSLECRLPFLSKKITDFASSLNSDQKISFFRKKLFLRSYANKHLPKFVLNKKKKGFEIPIKEWLRNDLYEWSKDLIYDQQNYNKLPIIQDKVKKLFILHQSKKRDVHPYLWSILMMLEFNRNRLNN